jgi:hypothetical protein
MLVETPQARSRIRHMVEQLPCPANLREDFAQEGQIHFWETETQQPGKTLSWYCEACRFYLRHEADRGRSVDSPKRRHLGCPLDLSNSADELQADELPSGDATPFEYVCALDMLQQLASRLDWPAQRILSLLLQGHTVRGAGALAGLSHPAVLKQRKRIASIAKELGLAERGEAGH